MNGSRRKTGRIKRIKPARSPGEEGGLGAWELAARYSYLDLNDGGVNGGRVSNWTAGVNWYANAFTRLSWNYTHSDLHDGGHVNIYQMRVQLAF